MEGPSSRLSDTQGGPLSPAGRRASGGGAESDQAQDTKTHFRVCRFIMETGKPQRAVCLVWKLNYAKKKKIKRYAWI